MAAEPHARYAVRSEVDTVQDFMRQSTANSILNVAQASRNSPIGRYINKFNPFEHVPQFRQLRQSTERHAAAS